MNFDFPLALVLLCALAGTIWLVEYFVFRKPRSQRLSQFLGERSVSDADFKMYVQGLDSSKPIVEGSEASKERGAAVALAQQTIFKQALLISRDPLPVEYAKSFFPVLFVVLILRSFLFEPFQIPSASMVPTLNVGDFIVVNKFAYGLRLPVIGTKILDIGEPKRGDAMVFVPPHDPRYFIKRVIGLPGDHVRYADNKIYVNYEPLRQDEGVILPGGATRVSLERIGERTHSIHTGVPKRLAHKYEWLDSIGRLQSGWLQPEGMVVPDGHYFMMGDNRDNSEDSRYWGPASEAKIVGKAVAVWMHKEPGWHLPTFGKNRLIENAK